EKVAAIEDAEVDAIELAQGVVDVTGLPFPEYAGNEQNSILDASSTEARDPNRKAHFELHYAHHSKLNGQPYDLSKELRGFFLRELGAASELVSMDDNGLGGYELHYSIPTSFSPTGDSQNHQVYIEKASSDPLDGNIRVTTITTVPDGEKANTA